MAEGQSYLVTCSNGRLLISAYLETIHWVEVFPGCWIVRANLTASQIANKLLPFLTIGDGLFVSGVGASASWRVPRAPDEAREKAVRKVLD